MEKGKQKMINAIILIAAILISEKYGFNEGYIHGRLEEKARRKVRRK